VSTAGFGQAKGRRRDREREAVFEEAERVKAEEARKLEAEREAAYREGAANGAHLVDVRMFACMGDDFYFPRWPTDEKGGYVVGHLTGLYVVEGVETEWTTWRGVHSVRRSMLGRVVRETADQRIYALNGRPLPPRLKVGDFVEFGHENIVLCCAPA